MLFNTFGEQHCIRSFTPLSKKMDESILGGSGNTVSHSHAAAFGCNVSSVIANTFHANNFMAQNMPNSNPGISVVLWYDPATKLVHRAP
jgi:hypothetical protein